MTFTEAAIEVLRREGKPLHFTKIAEIAAREDLLDHVGKIPEETMAGQLAAHCRLPKADRRVIAVQHGTFALTEWGLDEDPAGIDGLVEPPPADELPYRGRERHPIPSRDVARSSGRGEARGRRREEGEERRPRRFPPPSEVAYEILAGAGKALGLQEVAALGAERQLMPDAFVRDLASLRSALLEDNRRREGAGRKALFAIEEDTVTLVAQPEPGERAAPPRAAVGATEVRKSALAALRRRLRECDGPAFEHVATALLATLGYGDLKVVKRGREHAVYTARRRLGAAELRHAVRVLRGHGDVGRRDVQDLRRDISNYGAQIGVVIGTGDVQREARSEACAGGQLPILLLCGEALAETAAEGAVGCRQVLVPEVDEDFFREAGVKGAQEEEARRARREEREERERREGREGREGRRGEGRRAAGEVAVTLAADDGTPEAEGPPATEPSGEGQTAIIEVRATIDESEGGSVAAEDADDADGDDDEGAEEGPEEMGGAAGEPSASGAAPAEGEGRRRRRRRRRRRGGRGRREGAPGAPEPAQEAAPGGGTPAESRPPEGGAPPPPEPPAGGTGPAEG